MKTILYTTTIPLPQTGMASANRMLSIGRGLVERGHEVSIVTSQSDRGKIESFMVDGVTCCCVTNTKANENKIQRAFHYVQFIMRLTRHVFANRKRIECIIVYTYLKPVIFAVYGVSLLLSIPLISEQSEYPFHLIHSEESKGNLWRKMQGFIELHVLPKMYVGMIVMTRSLLTYLSPRVRRDCVLAHVPMTVDTNRFACACGPCEFDFDYIAYCGDMSNNKDGVDDLIKAFTLIASAYPKLHLVLFGNAFDADIARLKKISQQTGVESRILFTGRKMRDEMPNLLQNAKILALARPANIQAAGGFPTKLGEYLASARPVVVTKVGEIQDYLVDRKHAYLAEPSSPESVAACFREILDNYGQALIVGGGGMKLAQRVFSYRTQAGLVEDLINRICDTASQPI